jgi:hypothetical protein
MAIQPIYTRRRSQLEALLLQGDTYGNATHADRSSGRDR